MGRCSAEQILVWQVVTTQGLALPIFRLLIFAHGYCYGGFSPIERVIVVCYQQQLSEVERLLISAQIVQAKLKIVGYLAAATTSVFQCYLLAIQRYLRRQQPWLILIERLI